MLSIDLHGGGWGGVARGHRSHPGSGRTVVAVRDPVVAVRDPVVVVRDPVVVVRDPVVVVRKMQGW